VRAHPSPVQPSVAVVPPADVAPSPQPAAGSPTPLLPVEPPLGHQAAAAVAAPTVVESQLAGASLVDQENANVNVSTSSRPRLASRVFGSGGLSRIPVFRASAFGPVASPATQAELHDTLLEDGAQPPFGEDSAPAAQFQEDSLVEARR